MVNLSIPDNTLCFIIEIVIVFNLHFFAIVFHCNYFLGSIFMVSEERYTIEDIISFTFLHSPFSPALLITIKKGHGTLELFIPKHMINLALSIWLVVLKMSFKHLYVITTSCAYASAIFENRAVEPPFIE